MLQCRSSACAWARSPRQLRRLRTPAESSGRGLARRTVGSGAPVLNRYSQRWAAVQAPIESCERFQPPALDQHCSMRFSSHYCFPACFTRGCCAPALYPTGKPTVRFHQALIHDRTDDDPTMRITALTVQTNKVSIEIRSDKSRYFGLLRPPAAEVSPRPQFATAS